MKRTLSIVLCVVMVLMTFAGCSKKEKNHEHTFADEYSYDANNHWLPATCEHTDEMANFGQHVDEDEDGVCDICGYYDKTHEHTFAEEWSFDETNHWHAATCGHHGAVADKAPHVDENNDGVCDVCGSNGGHEHTYEEEWSSDEKEHWHSPSCGHDVDPIDKGEHVDEDNDGNCDICGWFDKNHTHTYSDEWTSDSMYHWHAATCEHTGSVSEKALHEDADEDGHCDTCGYLICNHKDDDMDGVCDICGWYDVEHEHTFDKVMSDKSGHWKVASCHPGATTEKEAHVDANRDGKCDVCGYVICAHSYSNSWSSNETHHWHEPTCNCNVPKKDYGAHVDANGDGVCDVCKRGQKAEKLYTDIKSGSYKIVADKTWNYCQQAVKVHLDPGKYVVSNSNQLVNVAVKGQEIIEKQSIIFNVTKSGDYEILFRVFPFDNSELGNYEGTYSIRKLHDLVLKKDSGKVELPTIVTMEFTYVAPAAGKYELLNINSNVCVNDELNITGLTLNATKAGEKLTFTVMMPDTPGKDTFEFEWTIRPKAADFVVEEGSNDVKIPLGKDIELEFVAPENGSYLFSATESDTWFGFWNDDYEFVETTTRSNYLAKEMKAGQKLRIYVQALSEQVDRNEVIKVTNVGTNLHFAQPESVNVSATEKRISFWCYTTGYYQLKNANGSVPAEFGMIKPDGSIEWVSEKEVYLKEDEVLIFYVRGKNGATGSATLSLKRVVYEYTLARGTTLAKDMIPGKEYTLNMPQDIGHEHEMTLSWDNRNIQVYINGEPLTSGKTIKYVNQVFTVKLLSNGQENVKFVLDYIPKKDTTDT